MPSKMSSALFGLFRNIRANDEIGYVMAGWQSTDRAGRGKAHGPP